MGPAPVPANLDTDPRVHFDKAAGKYRYEDEETGEEYEFTGTVWAPVVEDELVKAQQAAYSVAGVDENIPSTPALNREQKRDRKRKKADKDYTTNTSERQASPEKVTKSGSSAPKQTGVYISNLPLDASREQIAQVFSKAGVLLIDDEGAPRVKLYTDDAGKFKGEALVLYFKEASVDLAVRLLDDTELEYGAGVGNMKVKVAEYSKADPAAQTKEAGKPEEAAAETAEKPKEKKRLGREEKQKMSKRIKTLQNKLTWHSDSDSEDALTPGEGVPLPGSTRMARVVVLRGMFKLSDLTDDPGLLLELKEEVRDEAATLGQVTSVILYDLEPDGVMTVKFKDAVSAQACVIRMNGRFFDGRRISATIYTGKERFKRSGKGNVATLGDEPDDESVERTRVESFAAQLVDGSDEE